MRCLQPDTGVCERHKFKLISVSYAESFFEKICGKVYRLHCQGDVWVLPSHRRADVTSAVLAFLHLKMPVQFGT